VRVSRFLELAVRHVEVGGDDELLGLVYDELLRPNFPRDELVAWDDLRSAVLEGACVVSAVVDDGAAPVAAAVGDWDSGSRVLLLSYLAVRPDHRSRGLGGLLMQEVTGSWQDRFQPKVTLAEIEHPLAHPDAGAQHGDPVGRLRFYERHGARALDLPYFQPALRAGAERVHGMLLIVLAHPPAESPQRVQAAEPIRAFLTRYFRQTEGAVGEDPEASRLWRAIERPGGIPLLPLDDPAALPPHSAC
jgi:GNAT superfamily N-acetyltransferase